MEPTYKGIVKGGSMDGVDVIVVAWKPSAYELDRLKAGHPVFLSVCCNLPPHFLTTEFERAIAPA